MFTEDALGLIERTSPLRDVLTQVERAAENRNGVLICGEPGTGRGIVARAIHACQGRPDAPFVPVYCAGTDRAEIETLLFGAAGASDHHTPASHRCERVSNGSTIHAAIGGTIYFRNPEEVPTRSQSRLARLLRDQECQLGSRGPIVPCDVRPIVAADPDVESMVADGRIRIDLFRRFSANRIVLPPLRERRSDIPALAQLLLANACKKIGLPVKAIDSSANSVLSAMPWPGNTRELMGLIEVLAIKVADETVSLDAVLECVRLDGSPKASWNLGTTLRAARQHFEREYIAAVVAQFHGRVPDAARSLGIQRTNLYRKLRTLHIKADREKHSGDARMSRG